MMKLLLINKKLREEENDNQRGATIIIVALMLVVFLGFAALAIDIGYVTASRNEAQNVADAAALAGAGELGQQRYESDVDEITSIIDIKNTAHEVGLKHQVAGKKMDLPLEDIKIGYYEPDNETKWKSSGEAADSDAVRVVVHRKNVGTFFARILNIDFFNVSADATAALTGLGKVGEGDIDIPVGISTHWFEDPTFCNNTLKFSPTKDSCVGWSTFDLSPSSASTLRKDILDPMLSGNYESPEINYGDGMEFIGGDLSSAFDEFEALYIKNTDTDGDGVPDTDWETLVLVYQDPYYTGDSVHPCDNPGGSTAIVGFSTAIIKKVVGNPDFIIEAEVLCDELGDNRGGGGEYGTLGRIPGLVE